MNHAWPFTKSRQLQSYLQALKSFLLSAMKLLSALSRSCKAACRLVGDASRTCQHLKHLHPALQQNTVGLPQTPKLANVESCETTPSLPCSRAAGWKLGEQLRILVCYGFRTC